MDPFSSLLLSSGLNTAIDIKRPLLILLKDSLFHSQVGIQDGCNELLNPTANNSGNLNVSAHAPMYFYNSDLGFHDVTVNYEDMMSPSKW